MAELEVRLFGDIAIQHENRSPSILTGKALELFCYLLINRNRAHTRESLSEVLWPSGQPSVSKRYLRQALWRLTGFVQGGLDGAGHESGPLLISEAGWVRINPHASWWLDLSAFEQAYVSTRDTAGHHLSDTEAYRLEAATALYRGDLLAASYHDWCIDERDRLRLVYLAMLEQLMGYWEAQRQYAKGLGLGQIVLRHDPAREPTHRQMMLLYYRAGDRVAAIRQYERCAAILAQEFGVQPSAGIVALHEQIRADQVPEVTLPAPAGRADVVLDERNTIAALHARLDQIQASLLALHKSVLEPIRNGGAYHPEAGR